MKPRPFHALLLFLLFAVAQPAFAQTPLEGAPKLIDYQGLALDANGAVLAPTTPTNFTMKFRLYSTQSGGSPIWSESQTVTVDKGQFSVRLGQGIIISGEPRPSLETVYTGKDRYLGLTIVIPPQAEAEITPRLAFLSTPFAFVAERAKTADSVMQSAGTSTLGTTNITNLIVAGPGRINGANAMEFGGGLTKQADAGKIGYGTFTAGTLDIVGAGSAANGLDRKVKIFSEGGMTIQGPLSVSGDQSILAPSSLSFGSATRQMVNLWSTSFGLGVQNGTFYSRAGSSFAWFAGGVHNDNQFNPGAGGTLLATLSSNGLNITSGTLNVNTATNIASSQNSSSNIGTWSVLGNGSTGGRYWQTISSGSGNGEGAGKLLIGSGDSAGSTGVVMTMVKEGRVGINNSSPVAPLHVSGGVLNFFNLQGVLDGNGARDANENRNDLSHSIISDNRVQALAFDAVSDARIKTVLHPSDAVGDLSTLLGIQITDYVYKDTIGRGSVPQKKVIAQQVESIYPQAITKSVGVVPDIYQRAATADGWVMLATDLKVGDRVRLIADKGEGVHEVLEVKKDRFRTAFQPADSEVFVFGREVKDFRSVDYEAISMLNVSATQELHRKLSAAEHRVAELEANEKVRDARLTAIEKRLAPANPTIHKVAQTNEPKRK